MTLTLDSITKEAVEKALREFDRHEREIMLEKYGGGFSTRWYISHLGGFVTLTGFTPNLGKLSMAALRNVNGLASRRHAENSLQSLNVTMPMSSPGDAWPSSSSAG